MWLPPLLLQWHFKYQPLHDACGICIYYTYIYIENVWKIHKLLTAENSIKWERFGSRVKEGTYFIVFHMLFDIFIEKLVVAKNMIMLS